MLVESMLLCVVVWVAGFMAGLIAGFIKGHGYLQVLPISNKVRTEDLYPKRGPSDGSDIN